MEQQCDLPVIYCCRKIHVTIVSIFLKSTLRIKGIKLILSCSCPQRKQQQQTNKQTNKQRGNKRTKWKETSNIHCSKFINFGQVPVVSWIRLISLLPIQLEGLFLFKIVWNPPLHWARAILVVRSFDCLFVFKF